MVSSKWNALVGSYCTDIYFHCRSQKTCRLEKDSGVYTGLLGLSLSGMASGPVVVFSAQPRTVQKDKYNMSRKHQQLTANQIDKALEVNFTYLSMGNAVTALKCHFLDCLPGQMLNLQPEKLQQYLRELRYILYIYKTLFGHISGQTSAAPFTQTKNRTESPIPVISQLHVATS